MPEDYVFEPDDQGGLRTGWCWRVAEDEAFGQDGIGDPRIPGRHLRYRLMYLVMAGTKPKSLSIAT